MSLKETFISYLRKGGFDLFTACEIADVAVKEIAEKLHNAKIGTTLKYHFQKHTFTIKKTKSISKMNL